MGTAKKNIPLHRLREQTDLGYQVERVDISSKEAEKVTLLAAHRDDHYIILLQESGRSRVMVDFGEYEVRGRALMVILPGQVHQYISSDAVTTGWFVALDVGMMQEKFRSVLEDPLRVPGALWPEDSEVRPVLQCLEMIKGIIDRESAGNYDRQIVHGALMVLVALVCSIYVNRQQESPGRVLRPRLITQSFRKLLSERYKEMKSPGAYAAEMNLSLSYLNEVVKSTTGFAVSYWIQNEVVLEAKRLLYHSEYNVKEIAHELGYEDHAYFTRMFTKAVGKTPGAFRRYYRE